MLTLVEGEGQIVEKVYLSTLPPGIRATQHPKQLSSELASPWSPMRLGSDRVLAGQSILSFSFTTRTLEIESSEFDLVFAQSDILISKVGDHYCWSWDFFSVSELDSLLFLLLFPGFLSS